MPRRNRISRATSGSPVRNRTGLRNRYRGSSRARAVRSQARAGQVYPGRHDAAA